MGSTVPSLYLDPQIRDWVLFPITLVMILVGVLRHYVVVLLQSSPKKLPRSAIREQRALMRSNQGETPAPPNPLSDPAAMDGMMAGMRTQMVMMVPQMIVMGWINFFFEGFVLIKLPFPLTLGFKSMLQRGIQTADMDVRWVSSLSWYFLNFFGLNGLYRIILGGDEGGSCALWDSLRTSINCSRLSAIT
ncbi:integral membrane protein DUF106-domain-containing protein [Multifurca ochricompacta]|uniref:ER membrane protein complex subunit 3 n=1 Tax=Multifurca ochricompacta TaxID=376703 RepID=A0AAD4QSN6_9AGAM|nr:integral membrane protein DUF106-domain-containing protein [Multifurca ochricompacta]